MRHIFGVINTVETYGLLHVDWRHKIVTKFRKLIRISAVIFSSITCPSILAYFVCFWFSLNFALVVNDSFAIKTWMISNYNSLYLYIVFFPPVISYIISSSVKGMLVVIDGARKITSSLKLQIEDIIN